MKICKVENCNNIVKAKGYCAKHDQQIRRYGKIKERTKRDKNKIIEKEDFCEIELYNIDSEVVGYAKIDKDLKFLICKYKWYLGKNGYVISDSKETSIYLHRLIMGNPIKNVDHKDRNPLNCLRDNLRECTASQNGFNRKLNKNNKSGHNGISKLKDGRFEAKIKINYKTKRLGIYNTFEKAVNAYDKKAIEHAQEFYQKEK